MASTANPDYSVNESMWFDTDLETAFTGWTDPQAIASWFGPPGYTAEILELDLTPGGLWRFRMVPEIGAPSHHSGRYVEISRPNTLIFTWESEEDKHLTHGRDTLVTITFTEEAGGVRITILHEHLPTQEAAQSLTYGWGRGIICFGHWLRRLEE